MVVCSVIYNTKIIESKINLLYSNYVENLQY